MSLENSSNYSDYIVYVDESGDHSLQSIDDQYPIFVLSFCLFHKKNYTNKVAPMLQAFKFKHFGHDYVILHEHEIRKETGLFSFKNKADKYNFIEELGGIIEKSDFTIISCIIDKKKFKNKYQLPQNPYHIALKFCLERLFYFLRNKKQEVKITHIIVENRGKKEDKELELEFRRICDGDSLHHIKLPFYVIFADKKSNSTGLQLADLTARPIGLNFLRPQQNNKVFEILKEKLYCKSGGKDYLGYGIKIFPIKSEKLQ
ncbi:MAG: DUF3800 domain-containing protein [Francisellaceae bacterium]